MELTHRFSVPVPIDDAWEHFNDITSVAECFPGATVTSVEGDTFHGSVKVKLGPIALVYNGTGTFTEKDEATHRMVVDARGKDKRGNGTAGAGVVMTMTQAGSATDVEVVTDLSITGKPAQFGRGVMQDVSDKLLGQFVSCLEQRLEGSTAAPVAGSPEPVPEPEPTLTDESAPTAIEEPPPAPTAAVAPPSTAASTPPPATPAAPPASGAGGRKKDDDALDLGATVLPVLVKSYWRQALVALVLIVVVIWLIASL
jgi:carbon monoxide dehydrogenase subunit G